MPISQLLSSSYTAFPDIDDEDEDFDEQKNTSLGLDGLYDLPREFLRRGYGTE